MNDIERAYIVEIPIARKILDELQGNGADDLQCFTALLLAAGTIAKVCSDWGDKYMTNETASLIMEAGRIIGAERKDN